jgi:geranylgeranyl reductase family protein
MASAHFPFIVVGGGPAGTTAAEQIARHKRRVLIIEKSAALPYRDKPCGGGLGPITLKLFPYTRMQKVHETDTLKVTMDGEAISTKMPLVMVNREKLDYNLMERALRCGAKCHFGKTVHSIDLANKVVTIDNNFTISYDRIIGAGGATCPIARAYGVDVKHAPMIVGKANGGKLNLSTDAELHFFNDFKGYAWIFPKGKFLDIGIGGDAPMATMHVLLNAFLLERNLDLYDMDKWLLPYEPPWKTPIADENTVICGDAAGLVNPASGEGIRYAMQSGLEAAEVALGRRPVEQYPSFGAMLGRLYLAREKIMTHGIRKTFEGMQQNPAILKETIDFFFEDKEPPVRAHTTDTSKVETYRKMLEAIQEEE